jgi:hypothetical protein
VPVIDAIVRDREDQETVIRGRTFKQESSAYSAVCNKTSVNRFG